MNDRERLSWQHYIIAGGVAFLMPVVVICVQSAWVFALDRYYRSAAINWLEPDQLLSSKFWGVAAAIALGSFLILLPVLKLRLWRWVPCLCILVGWVWLLNTSYSGSFADMFGPPPGRMK